LGGGNSGKQKAGNRGKGKYKGRASFKRPMLAQRRKVTASTEKAKKKLLPVAKIRKLGGTKVAFKARGHQAFLKRSNCVGQGPRNRTGDKTRSTNKRKWGPRSKEEKTPEVRKKGASTPAKTKNTHPPPPPKVVSKGGSFSGPGREKNDRGLTEPMGKFSSPLRNRERTPARVAKPTRLKNGGVNGCKPLQRDLKKQTSYVPPSREGNA